MIPRCEVKDCVDYPYHLLRLDNVKVMVCDNHREPARKLAKEYGIKLFTTRSDIQGEFLEAVVNIKEE